MSATLCGDATRDGGAREPVAIVGFSFRFGGDAVSPDSFWSMISEGRTARSPIPPDRFNADAFYHPDTARLDRLPVRCGNFITEDIAAFDAPFFSIQPAEAAAMDPQSRKLLETTYRALENAGIPIEKCAGSKTCVFTGISSDDYRLMYVKDPSHPIRHAATGMATSMLANKISWFFDLKGPSVQLDTACSASLNALHLAFRSIQSGESAMGIVAGINLYVTPESLAPLAHLNFFSPDARCYSFDHRANGYTRGDGYGVFILKPLSQALLDGDPIRAVIKGTASNENGRTVGGITKVNLAAQQILIESAYRDADPSITRYVEAHAPGTEGDIVETTALASFFSPHRSEESPLYMGSVKANVGHLEGASGMVSLAKVVLMLEKGVIPRLANFERLHPRIRGEEWHMEFPLDNVPWPEGPRQASINSFGFGGANAHVVLGDGTKYAQLRQREPINSQPMLLVFSTADKEGIKRLTDAMATYLLSKLTLDDFSIHDLAYTLAKRRSRLPWKSAVVFHAPKLANTDTPTKLWQMISEPIRSTQPPDIVLIFTGQGAAWSHMGLQFMYNKAFRDSVEQSTAYLASLGACWDPIEELSKPQSESRIHEPLYAQYLCTTIQVAVVDMLRTFGMSARYTIGHSSGEIAAAYASGAISAKSALKIAYYRGSLIARDFPKSNVYGMLVVGLGESDMQSFMNENAGIVSNDDIHIACINSPRNVTLSGKAEALETMQHMLEAQSIFVRMLAVPAPYHSPLLGSIAREYEVSLGQLDTLYMNGATMAPTVEMISSVTGDLVSRPTLATATYWARNLLSPVRFEAALQSLLPLTSAAASNERKPKPFCLLEVGPYGVLRAPIRDTLKGGTLSYYSVMDKNAGNADRLFASLGQLHCLGYQLDLNAVNGITDSDVRCMTDIPEYPFNHSRSYWHESDASRNYRFKKHARHDLLGSRVHDWNRLTPRWKNCIRMLENPWIEDHRLAGALIYPGAGMIVMAVEAVAQYVGDLGSHKITGFKLANVRLLSALNVTTGPEGSSVELVLSPSKERISRSNVPSSFHFELYMFEDVSQREICDGSISVELDEEGSKEALLEHEYARTEQLTKFQHDLSACTLPIKRHKLYRGLKAVGLDLGPTFQVFHNVKHCPNQKMAAADIRLSNWTLKGDPTHASPHIVHPTALDGLLQLIIVALGVGIRRDVPTMVPHMIRGMWISSEGLNEDGSMTAVCRSKYVGLRHTASEVVAYDMKQLAPRVTIRGLETVLIDNESASAASHEQITMFHMQWKPYEHGPDIKPSATLSGGVEIIVTLFGAEHDGQTTALALRIATKVSRITTRTATYIPWTELDAVIAKKQRMRKNVHFLCIDSRAEKMQYGAGNIFLEMKSLLRISRSIAWITVQMQEDAHRPRHCHSIVTGLTRTLRSEHPECQFVIAALTEHRSRALLEKTILTAFQPYRLALGSPYEPELRSNLDHRSGTMTLQVPRLSPSNPDSDTVNARESTHLTISRSFQAPNEPPLKLSALSPGLLEGLMFVEDESTPRTVGKEDIVLEPAFVGLNFLDVLTALGRIPQNAVLGIEGAGIVLEVGENTDIKPGDRVAMLTDGTLRSRVTTDYRTVVRLPEKVSCQDAASMIGTACTAYRALVDIAQIQPDESVLIHAGAGATGQMAIQLALHLGATVYVTVGSERKRKLVEEQYKIPSGHIFNSRDTSFIAAVRRVTSGCGVDVVLNSVAGNLLHSAWEQIVAPFGRWIEIGKRDIIDNQELHMRPFLNNVTFSCIDLTGIWKQRPALMRRLLENVIDLISDGAFRPPSPVTTFEAADIQEAFRTLQSGKRGGKIVVNVTGNRSVHAHIRAKPRWSFRQDRSYLVVGAFGGLGQHIVKWMARRGAKSLILLSRSGVGRDEKRVSLLDELEAMGCSTSVHQCDVSDALSLRKSLAQCAAKTMSIAGCIQASMVLKDKYFDDMTLQDWTDSTAPKADGSYNLDQLLPQDLDFFLFMSSLVGIVGAIGQSNYSAASTFQDNLARGRVARGQKAVSLDLGMFVDEGAVSEDQGLARTMESFGHYQPMEMHHLDALLDKYCDPSLPLLAEEECQIVCGIRPPASMRTRNMQEPRWMAQPMFEALHDMEDIEEPSSLPQGSNLQEELTAADSIATAASIIIEALIQKLSTALAVPVTEIDATRPMHLYGVDSLAATELRNWFVNKLHADVAILHILGNDSIEAIAMIAAQASHYTAILHTG